ncbi:glycosyltransferase [Candidatus Planktophila vernalis]|uniref:Glycosyltransferase n=1 Tax=Candidatus Planktophila vernalis TaxID=1884907 RepID=A0A249KUL9_9ACTN|nr:glycosyltransferase [Candidatus Planktophila vernalis]ASY20500.1 glycosyltransferase [Candidatus Planktophila vernalis]
MTASNSKIKIMHVISRMNVGGPAVMISNSIQMLDSDMFEQKVFAGECESGEADYLQTHGQEIDVTMVKGLGRKINLRGDLYALISLTNAIKRDRPDIIHTHASKAGLLGRTAAVLSRHNVHLVHTFHGHILFGYFNKLKTTIFVCIERILAKKTDVLIAVGHKVAADLLAAKIGRPDKYVVVHPGVIQPKEYLKNFAHEQLGLDFPESNLVCGFFGRVTGIKRPDRFLELVQKSSQRSLPISFFIAGEGDLSQSIRSQINDLNLPVKWLGWQADVGLVMSALDVLVICSDNEGLPLSAIEAGYMSKLVIGTNVGSISEVISDEITGFITERESNEVVEILELLLRNQSMLKEMGISAKEKIENQFGLSKYLAEMSRLYISLAPFKH